MKEISVRFRFLLFFNSFILQFVSGLSDKPSGPKNEKKVDAHTSSSTEVLVICIAIVVLALLSFFLYKVWQKKKREEQYARLLKLFEDDDELDLELGIHD